MPKKEKSNLRIFYVKIPSHLPGEKSETILIEASFFEIKSDPSLVFFYQKEEIDPLNIHLVAVFKDFFSVIETTHEKAKEIEEQKNNETQKNQSVFNLPFAR
jgi:hypothetical protein